VDSLVEETEEIAQFATCERGKIVYLYKSRGENAVKTASFLGKQEHLHSTALRKAILSTMTPEEVNRSSTITTSRRKLRTH